MATLGATTTKSPFGTTTKNPFGNYQSGSAFPNAATSNALASSIKSTNKVLQGMSNAKYPAPAMQANTPTPNYSQDVGSAQNTAYYTPDSSYGGGYIDNSQAIADQQAKDAALLQIDQGLGNANDALSRLGTQEQNGLGNVDREYQQGWQQLLGQQGTAQRDYNANRTDQVNQYESKRATNGTNARNWLDGALRTLGTQGAGNGSAARYGLPYEAQTQASQANAADQQTNNHNLVALDTNWADTQDKIKNAQNDLTRQRDQGKNDFESQIANQRATLLQTIAQLTGQENIANGGNYQSALAAANPYMSQIPALLDKINALSITPNIAPQAVTLTKPTLSSYNYAQPDAPVVAPQDQSIGSNPVLAGILGYDPNQQDQNQNQILQFA